MHLHPNPPHAQSIFCLSNVPLPSLDQGLEVAKCTNETFLCQGQFQFQLQTWQGQLYYFHLQKYKAIEDNQKESIHVSPSLLQSCFWRRFTRFTFKMISVYVVSSFERFWRAKFLCPKSQRVLVQRRSQLDS